MNIPTRIARYFNIMTDEMKAIILAETEELQSRAVSGDAEYHAASARAGIQT